MPLFKGSLTYTRFFVDASADKASDKASPRGLDATFADRCLEKLAARPFEPLDPEADAVERMGWCRVGEPFETTFTYGDLFWNDHMLLGLRVDRWVVPPSLVKAKTREAEVAYLARKGRERASKKEKAELKALAVKKLRKQLAPSTRVVDLAFSMDEGVVRFLSHSTQLGGAMCELFRTTFGVALVPESPYTGAARIGLDALAPSGVGEVAWVELEPTDLTVSPEPAPRAATSSRAGDR